VVTRGSGELGRVIIRTWAHGGAGVAMHDCRQQAHARGPLEERQALGVQGMTGQADVTHPASADARREAIVHTLGVPPHILVNHAGIPYQPWTNVLEQPITDYEGQCRSSVVHHVLMAKVLVPAMRRHHDGRCIASSTAGAMQPRPGPSADVAGHRGMDGVLRG
jgi:3-oxoacyl-[acyl-carrier protein] reductase